MGISVVHRHDCADAQVRRYLQRSRSVALHVVIVTQSLLLNLRLIWCGNSWKASSGEPPVFPPSVLELWSHELCLAKLMVWLRTQSRLLSHLSCAHSSVIWEFLVLDIGLYVILNIREILISLHKYFKCIMSCLFFFN